MSVVVLSLPSQIRSDELWPFLAQLGAIDAGSEIAVDFSNLTHITSVGIAALVAQVNRWMHVGRKVSFRGTGQCAISSYLKRMDVFEACGLDQGEKCPRDDSSGRFVPVQKIGVEVDKLGSEMALCIAPGGDDFENPAAGLYDLVWYVLTEAANNVRQHSAGSGYAVAQVGTDDFVRIAIADNGKGVRQSFVDAGLPWSTRVDDVGAIGKALLPRVSSKGSPTNEGVGLTLTAELARLIGAWLLICSGAGCVWRRPDGSLTSGVLPNKARYHGTLVGLTFDRNRVKDFAELMNAAKQEVGLLQRRTRQGRFEP